MTGTGLSQLQLEQIQRVLRDHPHVRSAILFGSRAKGTALGASDIDLALEGIADPLEAQHIASDLEELPIPYQFDVQALGAIAYTPLLAHIDRVGIRIYEREESDHSRIG